MMFCIVNTVVPTMIVLLLSYASVVIVPGVVHAQPIVTYRVTIQSLLPPGRRVSPPRDFATIFEELSPASDSFIPPYGFASIFTDATALTVGYAGIAANLEPSVYQAQCTALNGCGVHIHSGRSCNSTATQGGHYYNNVSVPIDPWIDERYTTNTNGKTNFRSIVKMGTIDIVGRVFIVHSRNGTRIGCGVIERVPSDSNQLLSTATARIAPSTVTSTVVVHNVEPDTACYFGTASNLEPNLVSFLNKNASLMGINCNATNGCGVHLHNGTSCSNTTTQGGHYYNKVRRPIDPWLYTMYDTTYMDGTAHFTGCVETGFGVSNFLNRPFVIHSNNGTRVSCGLLTANPTSSSPSAPVKAPVKTPVEAPQAPVKAPQAPVKAPQAPVKAPQAPVEAPQAPVEAPQAPVETPQAPVEAPQAPVEASQAPVEASQAPVEASQAPVETPQPTTNRPSIDGGTPPPFPL